MNREFATSFYIVIASNAVTLWQFTCMYLKFQWNFSKVNCKTLPAIEVSMTTANIFIDVGLIGIINMMHEIAHKIRAVALSICTSSIPTVSNNI